MTALVTRTPVRALFDPARVLSGQLALPHGRRLGYESRTAAEMNKALRTYARKALILLVGARGFEPPTTCTPCRYATRLRYAPKEEKYIRHSEVLEPGDSSLKQKPVSFTLPSRKWRSFRQRA